MILQFAQTIERVALTLPPAMLLGSGTILTLPGLIIWLGGLNIGRIATVVTGGLLGSTCGYILTGHSTPMLGLWLLAGMIAALVIEQALITTIGTHLLYNLILSLSYALSGTLFIFIGMILLLLYKGSDPTLYIATRQNFFATVIFAMVAFGTIEQLVLAPKPRKLLTRPRSPIEPIQPQNPHSWRNR